MGVQAVDLFGDIGFDRDQRQFLRQPVGIHAFSIVQHPCKIALERQ